MLGITTIREGQRVAVWSRDGQVRYVDGPRRLWLFSETIEPLQRYSAEADEYLVVRYLDGRKEHRRGPADLWFDPLLHEEIVVERAVPIDAHEALVVYERQEDETVTRQVVRGPVRYVPNENQWLHEFRWHGADPKQPNRKVPRGLVFRKLRVIPDQMYFDVEDVRTSDDALLVVKLMMFFQLVDIDRMLDQTHDPIADFINAVSADIIDFAASRTFEQFKQDTAVLNDLDQYENLTRRAGGIGYRINNVVYRGYLASEKLQAMHDDAIEARTALKLEAETERQAQELADLKLAREAERSAKQRDLARLEAEHEQQLAQLAHEQELRQQQSRRQQQLALRRQSNQLKLEHLKAENQEQAGFLAAMQGMQVDLTRFLVAQYQNPDRLIRVEGGQQPAMHLHD